MERVSDLFPIILAVYNYCQHSSLTLVHFSLSQQYWPKCCHYNLSKHHHHQAVNPLQNTTLITSWWEDSLSLPHSCSCFVSTAILLISSSRDHVIYYQHHHHHVLPKWHRRSNLTTDLVPRCSETILLIILPVF